MTKSLGKLERVELRDIWATEDRDFTPWLAQQSNLELLAETIGMELELEAQEKDVGPFRADILCKNTLDNSWVLIENQIERTDHKHLGQLLTYAAGLQAVTIVWVASKFTEEHRAALDWLNKITDENFRFFGLEVELWRVDDSIPAPKFNVISQVNDWSKNVSTAAKRVEAAEKSNTKSLQLKYWTHFSQYLSSNSKISLRTPQARNWADFSLGKTNATLRLTANAKNKKIIAGVYLSKDMKSFYDALLLKKSDIESELNYSLIWENNPNKDTAVIKIEKQANISDESNWAEQQRWLQEMLENFNKVFRPLIKSA